MAQHGDFFGQVPDAGTKETPRGLGVICGWDDCEARFVVNIEHVNRLIGRKGNSRRIMCPACERRSELPRDYQ